MYKEIQIRVKPEEAGDECVLKRLVSGVEKIREERIVHVEIVRRSIDARQREVWFNLTVGAHIDRYE
ncbi:MAG: FAD-binding protein, partial [Odoribacter sp.]|nr:FAD-binding protein [Odoribacter sp.]